MHFTYTHSIGIDVYVYVFRHPTVLTVADGVECRLCISHTHSVLPVF